VKNNETGFGIIQVMVAISATIAISYFTMFKNEDSNKLHSKKIAEEAMNSASEVIKTALSHTSICAHNLKDQSVGYALPALKTTSDTIIAATDQVYPQLLGIKLQSMKIQTFKDPITEETNDYFYVVYEIDPENKKRIFGSSTIGRKFKLRVEKDSNGKIISCYHEESNLVEQSKIKHCEDMKGTWANNKCSIDANNLVDSQPVVCSPGKLQIIVVNEKVKTACKP